MPICPYPACNCGHANLTMFQYQEHVRTSPWAARFCPSCKSVCGSELALLKVSAHAFSIPHCLTSLWLKHNKNVHGIGGLPGQPSTSTVRMASPSPRPASAASTYPPHVRPDRYCTLCKREVASPAALKQHYRDLKGHPKCASCNEGFLDDAALAVVRASLLGGHSGTHSQ